MDDDDRCEWRGRSNAHNGGDGREWRRWSALVATVWIQAVTGTNFDFSAYSSALKSSLGVSQQCLNYLATASDLGKAFGWSSGLALLYMPLPAVLLLSAALGLAAYVVQYCVLLSSSPSPPAIPYPVANSRKQRCNHGSSSYKMFSSKDRNTNELFGQMPKMQCNGRILELLSPSTASGPQW